MFRGKSELDKHVNGLLYRAKTEEERNLRCFHIAKLYFKIQDYESVQRYINMYLSSKDDSAAAHKLLGQALEGLGQKDKAIAAYTKSLKLEPDQSDLVSKVCELLCDKDVEFDPVLARHWSEKASLLFPHSLPVFMLKEKLLTVDSSTSSKDLEELLQAELKAKPTDVSVRIKLLKLYSESGRSEMAINHAFEVESRQPHLNNLAWYQCLNKICKAYNRDHYAKCSWEFYINWLIALDRLCLLSLTEQIFHSCDLSEAVDSVYSLDQAIYNANQCPSRTDKFGEFLKVMSTQLAYLLGVLLIKKTKKENSQWKETKRLIGPLFVLATSTPCKIDQNWRSGFKDNIQKTVEFWMNHIPSRQVQAGHTLLSLVKECNSEKLFLDKLSHFMAGDWRKQIFEKAFNSVGDRKSSTSHLLTSIEFAKFHLKIPSSNMLKPSVFVSYFENTYPGSLHHLVWLGLRSVKKDEKILEMKLHSFSATRFKSLHFTINNLNNIGVETINQLDVDSFLYITVFCTASILEENKSNGFSIEDSPQVLPADVSSPLCTGEQAKWWSSLCTLASGNSPVQMNSNESMADVRFTLQRGLEVVRGEGLSPILIVSLARTFVTRGESSNTDEEIEGCMSRALHLWQVAYPVLERLAFNKSYVLQKMNTLFECPVQTITPNEAKTLLEEAKFYIGCHYYNTGYFEKAINELKGIKTPQALMYLGLVYQKWAEQQIEGLKNEDLTQEISNRNIALLTKAKDYLSEAKSMLKNDPKNPLLVTIESQLSEVQDILATYESENGDREKDVNGTSNGSPFYAGGVSPERIQILGSSSQRSHHHHTSTPHRHYEQKASHFNMSDLIDYLSVQQSTNQLKMQQVIEQIRIATEKLDIVASEQRALKNIVDNVSSRLNAFETEMKTNISDIKKDLKRPELPNVFDEDDYTEEMLQYPQGYQQYFAPPQRAVPNTATAPLPAYSMNSMNHYYSPRIDPLCQGFYSQQGALPFSEGQQLPDFFRPQKGIQPLIPSVQPGFTPSLNLAAAIPGPSRVPTAPGIPPNVLLTTADTLPSVTPTIQPQLSVNIPTTSRPPVSSNAPHNFQIPLPQQPKPVLNIEEREIEEETPPPTYDPLPDYKPIVPLPDEVEVHTGEEDEEVLFERRAKLYRFTDKTWKERGVGNLKILKNKTTGKVRIVMRREQVHKICANHFLTSDMELKPKTKTEHAWIWFANDFAEEKIQPEQFCAKFKTQEDSDEFKSVFDKAKEDLDVSKSDSASSPNVSTSEPNAATTKSSAVDSPASENKSGFFSTSTSGGFLSSTFSNFSFSNSGAPAAPSATFSFTASGNSSNKSQNVPSEVNSKQINATVFFTKPPEVKASQDTRKQETNKLLQSALFPTSSPQETGKSTSSILQPPKLGGFTFLAEPKLKDTTDKKDEGKEAPKEPSPFTKFSFGTTAEPPKNSFSVLSNLASKKTDDLPNPFSVLSSAASKKTDDLPNPFAISKAKPKISASNEEAGDVSKKLNDEPSNEKSDGRQSPATNDDGEVDNFEPDANFQPVIPLPDLITVQTGEENEEVIFEDRAQLFRFCKETRQWKERGTGQMKILKHRETGSYRLLMRREQVLKVCCNHRITKDIKLKPTSSSDRAFSWGAKDHSEEPPTDELFSLRFKKAEQAQRFKEAFENCQKNVDSTNVVDNSKGSSQPPLSTLVKKPPGSWECKSCYIQNKADLVKCAACNSEKAGSTSAQIASSVSAPKNTVNTQPSLAEQFKPKPGSWECQVCYVRCAADAESCLSCGTPKPGSVPKKTEGSMPGGFTFGIPDAQCKSTVPKKTEGSLSGGFTFGIPDTQSKSSGFNIGSSATSFTFSQPSQNPVPDVLKPKDSTEKPPSSIFGTGAGFNFSAHANEAPSWTSSPVLFAPKDSTDNSAKPLGTTSFLPGFSFNLSSGTSESTNSNQPTYSEREGSSFPSTVTPSEPKFGSASFKFVMPTPNVPNSPGNVSQHDESGYDPEEEEEESHIQFQPVIPLPDKIDVVTGEEDENLLYSHRAKLFRYDNNTKEWKERGLGDVKILQHKESGKIRLLMRREPIMKVCLNHFLTPDIELKPKKDDDKSWMWAAVDFSEGTQVNESFAIRFKNSEIANNFKDEFNKAKLLLGKQPVSSTALSNDNNSSKDIADDEKSSGSESSGEVVFVSEQKAPPELVEKALALQLPPNYYCYLDKPKCTGCKGCESETEDESEDPKEKEGSQNMFSKSIFGGVQSPSIFGNSGMSSQGAGFNFGLAFSSPSNDKKDSSSAVSNESQKGFLFKDPASFNSPLPQKNIFSSGSNKEMPGFLSSAVSSMPSFDALSKSSSGTPLTPSGTNFKFEGAGTPVFGGKAKSTTSNANKTKLQIPLPSKPGSSASEEEFNTLFSERVTLHKYENDSKEWKDVGTGNLKIMKHKTLNDTILVTSNSDQKIMSCNLVTKDFNLSSGDICKWQAKNYVDGKVSNDNLSVTFLKPENVSKFKVTIEECKRQK